MDMKIVDASYKHEIDGKDKQNLVMDRNKSVEPNAGLRETVEELGNNGRLNMQYNVGKKPEVRSVAPGEIESLRPAKAEFKNG